MNAPAADSYGYDGVGNLRSQTLGNGVTNVYTYDPLNRVTNIIWRNGSGSLIANARASAATSLKNQ